MDDCASCGRRAVCYSHMGESGQCEACYRFRWGIAPTVIDIVEAKPLLHRTEEDEGPTSQPEDPRADRDFEGGF